MQTPIVVTPTSSYRSLLAWHQERPQAPIILKVSLDVRYDDVLRVIPEKDIVRATIVGDAVRHTGGDATKERL